MRIMPWDLMDFTQIMSVLFHSNSSPGNLGPLEVPLFSFFLLFQIDLSHLLFHHQHYYY